MNTYHYTKKHKAIEKTSDQKEFIKMGLVTTYILLTILYTLSTAR